MKYRVRILAVVVPAMAAAGLVWAQAPPAVMVAPPTRVTPGYLLPGSLDGKSILGPPPAQNSAHGKADWTLYEETRALAGTPRWKTAIQDNDLWGGGALKRFSCALGVDLNDRQTPITWKILHKIETDVRTLGTPAKDFYGRVRPAIRNELPICVPREDWMRTNASYPSGHAMTAWSWGLILAEALPARADAVLMLGKDSGDSRMICGVHFISDVEAGRTLGSAMVARLHSNAEFVADLKKAKRELRKAKTVPVGCDG